MEIKKTDIKEKHKNIRTYAHFDKRLSFNSAWHKISNPKYIETHSFYPFFKYTLTFNKYNKCDGIKEKTRDVAYASHIDRYVYMFYSYKFNKVYNKKLSMLDMDKNVIAYRDNIGKNNIHFSKEAFDFMKDNNPCYVMIGDFTGFFDNLEDKYLKKMLCSLLEVNNLKNDYYAVFKNITKYSYWDIKDLFYLHNLSSDNKDFQKSLKILNEKDTVLNLNEFRKNKRKYLKINKEGFGIPQGSPISAVLSNIYMLDFDLKIKTWVENLEGKYMRYSDDFIIIIPKKNIQNSNLILNFIENEVANIPKLELQTSKTYFYEFINNTISKIKINRNESNKSKTEICCSKANKSSIDYLGFTFDGNYVYIRDKTISKYYRRLNKKIKTIIKCNGITKNGNKISCKNLYEKYSIKGATNNKGNFISYVQRATKIYGA